MKRRKSRKSNYLIREKSPYLLQHAYNPVNWYPWGDKAFAKAHNENKPIFLSIGYSTCHWCHVMQKESFEDTEVAKLLNDTFVCVKVDREERPDIDNLYMSVCQLMTGSGGWPLTIVMTPNKKPFYAATYIPKKTRSGRIGLIELIPQIRTLWYQKQDRILHTVNQVAIALEHISHVSGSGFLDKAIFKTTYEELRRNFDENYGGFGNAPKFPTPHNLLFLLRYWKLSGEKKPLEMVEKTLVAMRSGGIYDHIGFGFHRYSTDRQWLVPHFEKMLYDQALLAYVYTETYQVTRKKVYEKTAREIFNYVSRAMTSPQGAFYSAEDADSEGKEGKFYVWSYNEIKRRLGRDTNFILKVFGVEKGGNFVEESSGRETGRNILHLQISQASMAREFGMSEQSFLKRLERVRKRLLRIREQRIHPHKDDKILTDWNGLMIAALAKGAQVFHDSQLADVAKRATSFILNIMQKDGRLLHRFRDGEAALSASIDDYAFLIWGLIELYEATFEPVYLETALNLNTDMIKLFWDHKNGGFYFTPEDGEHLMVRQKQFQDSALPSGNSVAMWNLVRLGHITANLDFEKMALEMAELMAHRVKQFPQSHAHLVVALDLLLGGCSEVVVVGDLNKSDTQRMIKAIRNRFLPHIVVVYRPCLEEKPEIARLAPYTEQHNTIKNRATAYICVEAQCKLPTTNIQKMLRMLSGQENLE